MHLGGWKYTSLRVSAYLSEDEALIVPAPLPSNPGRRVNVNDLTLRVETRSRTDRADIYWEGQGRFVLKDGSPGRQRTQRAVKVTDDQIPDRIRRAMLEEAARMVEQQREAIRAGLEGG